MKSKCVKIKLKPDCLEQARAWAAEINARADEALVTLRAEGVVIESAFLDQTSEGDFLIYFMRAENFERATAAAQQSTCAIDAYHRQFKENCWAERRSLEMLIDLAIDTREAKAVQRAV